MGVKVAHGLPLRRPGIPAADERALCFGVRLGIDNPI